MSLLPLTPPVGVQAVNAPLNVSWDEGTVGMYVSRSRDHMALQETYGFPTLRAFVSHTSRR